MRLTADEIREAFEAAANAGRVGEPVSWQRIADELNTRLADNLVGRGQARGGKHQRPELGQPIEAHQ